MELNLSFQLLTLFATMTLSLGQQQLQGLPQNDASQRSAPLLGVRYSAATDVSHISFNSPLVTYGSPLNEIQLPAAPVQPANLKQASQYQEETSQPSDDQTLGAQGQTHQLQAAATPVNQPQFISVQQFPANPQLQSQPQSFTYSQNLPGNQQQTPSRSALAQQQPTQRYAPTQFPTVQSQQQQFALGQQQPALRYTTTQVSGVQSQQQQFPLSQQQYISPSAQPLQQYFPTQPQQYVFPQQQQVENAPNQQYLAQQPFVAPQQQLVSSAPASNGYFATGPYAAQYQQPNLLGRQVLPQYPQTVAPASQFVSRVAFNGPTSGFSYSF